MGHKRVGSRPVTSFLPLKTKCKALAFQDQLPSPSKTSFWAQQQRDVAHLRVSQLGIIHLGHKVTGCVLQILLRMILIMPGAGKDTPSPTRLPALHGAPLGTSSHGCTGSGLTLPKPTDTDVRYLNRSQRASSYYPFPKEGKNNNRFK